MKNALLLISAIFLISFSAMSGENKLIKSCQAALDSPDDFFKISSKFEIYQKNNKSLSSTLTQTLDGYTRSEVEVASLKKYKVRSGLNGEQYEDLTLNIAEQLIIHAMLMTEDPDFGGVFKTGVDLKKVRSAVVYTIGDESQDMPTQIIEARDENGQHLGSFLGGFLVHPCK